MFVSFRLKVYFEQNKQREKGVLRKKLKSDICFSASCSVKAENWKSEWRSYLWDSDLFIKHSAFRRKSGAKIAVKDSEN